MIGAQCVVVKHIEESDGVYIGVPSKKLKSLKK
jgi:serine acetyltransferase